MGAEVQNSPNESNKLQAACDEEFKRYETERELLRTTELQAEKTYDTTLVTLATLAIGSSFTILKDIVQSGHARPLIMIAWLFLGCCLFIALTDQLLTYWTHQEWRTLLDDEFNNWVARGGPGAWQRVAPKYETIPGVKILRKLKWASFGTLLLGILFLMVFVVVAGEPPGEKPAQPPPVVNIYNNSTTQPLRP